MLRHCSEHKNRARLSHATGNTQRMLRTCRETLSQNLPDPNRTGTLGRKTAHSTGPKSISITWSECAKPFPWAGHLVDPRGWAQMAQRVGDLAWSKHLGANGVNPSCARRLDHHSSRNELALHARNIMRLDDTLGSLQVDLPCRP